MKLILTILLMTLSMPAFSQITPKGETPCLIELKKTGGVYTLNANFIMLAEEKTINLSCSKNFFEASECKTALVTKLTLANKEIWLTFTSLQEIKENIQSQCSPRGVASK